MPLKHLYNSSDIQMRFVITRRESLDLPDGINSFIFSCSDAMTKSGHDVHIISPTHSCRAKVADYFDSPKYTNLHSLSDKANPTHREMLVAWQRHGLRLVAELEPDLVMVNGALPFRMPSPSCTISHDLERRWSYGSLVRRIYKMYCYRTTNRTVATCTELRDSLAAEIHMANTSINIIPTCINTNVYANRPLHQREAAILHMGAARYKNPIATVNAFAWLQPRAANLYMTGNPSVQLKSRLAELPTSIRDRIYLLGIVPASELRRLLSTVRVVSVPSTYVAPVASPTVLESFASGTPVVTTPSISKDLLEHGQNGFSVNPSDAAAMAKLFDLLLTDDASWIKMSSAATLRSSLFDGVYISEKYVTLAKELSALRQKVSAN